MTEPRRLPDSDIYVISGADISQNQAHEISEHWAARFPDKRAIVISGEIKVDSLDRITAAALGKAVRAAVQLKLVSGATDAVYTPTEVAELVSAAIDEQLARLGIEA